MAGRAIVTGANRGIGRACAVDLAKAGFDVGITWHEHEEEAQSAAEEIGGLGRRAAVRRMDLTELPDAAGAIDELADELGGVDVFVNNAGAGERRPFLEFSWEDWTQVIDTDLNGAFLCCQRAARRMADAGNGGRIIAITSVHEHIPLRQSSAYCAAKGGLGLLVKEMALELAEHGITVNAVAPGEIATPMTGNPDVDPRQVERPSVPLGRPGDAHEIAATVVFLASPGAAYATGASFIVDGGLMLTAADQD